MKQFVMLSGIPRSGSQVLSSMLNQHPSIHATTTSPVADMLGILHDQWIEISQAVYSPYPGQLNNMLNGTLLGAYKHVDKPIIIDKNRLWPRYSKLLNGILDYRPKIICTVRDIPEVLSSYILLIEKNKHKITYIDQDIIDLNLPVNNKNRCKVLWEKYITHPYNSLRIGVNSNEVDLLFVDYRDIVSNGQYVIDRICKFIGIPSFLLLDTELQRMDEHDKFHGGLEGLHDVRPVLEKVSPPPEQVIGNELTNFYKSMNLEFWKKYDK